MLSTYDITRTTDRLDRNLSQRPSLDDFPDSPIAYQSLSVIKKLSKTKFPVYLAYSKINRQYYAMKVFSYVGEDLHEYFKNEIRFASLQHQNIIDMIYYEYERETIQRGELKKVSYILMDFAPYGDFFDFVTKFRTEIDEKLTRTYFRQLIEGIEYLHARGIAHLDLKPENLLLDANFTLKIADFDLSYIYGDARVLSKGTKYYRAPEFFRAGSSNTVSKVSYAADIYSAGIILFILKSGGMYPHAEDDILEGINFVDLMYRNNSKFWAKQCSIQDKKSCFYDRAFKDLFNNMVKFNPNERFTLNRIKQSKWYNGPVYTHVELHDKMKRFFNC